MYSNENDTQNSKNNVNLIKNNYDEINPVDDGGSLFKTDDNAALRNRIKHDLKLMRIGKISSITSSLLDLAGSLLSMDVYGVLKNLLNARDAFSKHKLNNICILLNRLEKGKITPKNIEKFRKSLESDKRSADELCYIAKCVEDAYESEKALCYGSLIEAAMTERVDFPTLMEYVSILHKAFLPDIRELGEIWELDSWGFMVVDSVHWGRLDRLSGYGIGERMYPIDKDHKRVLEDNMTYFYYNEYSKEFMNIILGKGQANENISTDVSSYKIPLQGQDAVLNCGGAKDVD